LTRRSCRTKNAYRPLDVLHPLLANVDERRRHLPVHLFAHRTRHADPARLGQRLKPQAGQMDASKEAGARLVKAQPDITIEVLRNRRYSSHSDYRRWEENELFAGLRKAGIPEK
jgi:hypothetical protein